MWCVVDIQFLKSNDNIHIPICYAILDNENNLFFEWCSVPPYLISNQKRTNNWIKKHILRCKSIQGKLLIDNLPLQLEEVFSNYDAIYFKGCIKGEYFNLHTPNHNFCDIEILGCPTIKHLVSCSQETDDEYSVKVVKALKEWIMKHELA